MEVLRSTCFFPQIPYSHLVNTWYRYQLRLYRHMYPPWNNHGFFSANSHRNRGWTRGYCTTQDPVQQGHVGMAMKKSKTSSKQSICWIPTKFPTKTMNINQWFHHRHIVLQDQTSTSSTVVLTSPMSLTTQTYKNVSTHQPFFSRYKGISLNH